MNALPFRLALAVSFISISAALMSCKPNDVPSLDSSRSKQALTTFQPPREDRVLIAAHRGCHSIHPENSIQGFNYCREIGVEVAEIDFTMTLDDELIVFHDGVLDRMTTGSGKTHELTFEQIRNVFLKASEGGEGSGVTLERIPTLEEISKEVDPDLFFMVDIKSTPVHSREYILKRVVEQAVQFGMHERMLWMVKTPQQIGIVQAGSPDGTAILMPSVRRVGQPAGGSLEELVQYQGVFGAQVLLLNPGDETWFLSQAKSLKSSDRHVFGYNRMGSDGDDQAAKEGWDLLINQGATAIVTDRPEKLIGFLENKSLRQ